MWANSNFQSIFVRTNSSPALYFLLFTIILFVFFTLPHAHALLVYMVLLLLTLLLLFQWKSGSVTFSTYVIYSTIVTMSIS